MSIPSRATDSAPKRHRADRDWSTPIAPASHRSRGRRTAGRRSAHSVPWTWNSRIGCSTSSRGSRPVRSPPTGTSPPGPARPRRAWPDSSCPSSPDDDTPWHRVLRANGTPAAHLAAEQTRSAASRGCRGGRRAGRPQEVPLARLTLERHPCGARVTTDLRWVGPAGTHARVGGHQALPSSHLTPTDLFLWSISLHNFRDAHDSVGPARTVGP